jgi:hypothetical protein
MWEPRRLTSLLASTAFYRDSFIFTYYKNYLIWQSPRCIRNSHPSRSRPHTFWHFSNGPATGFLTYTLCFTKPKIKTSSQTSSLAICHSTCPWTPIPCFRQCYSTNESDAHKCALSEDTAFSVMWLDQKLQPDGVTQHDQITLRSRSTAEKDGRMIPVFPMFRRVSIPLHRSPVSLTRWRRGNPVPRSITGPPCHCGT